MTEVTTTTGGKAVTCRKVILAAVIVTAAAVISLELVWYTYLKANAKEWDTEPDQLKVAGIVAGKIFGPVTGVLFGSRFTRRGISAMLRWGADWVDSI